MDSSKQLFLPFVVMISLILTLPMVALIYGGYKYVLRSIMSSLFIESVVLTLLGALIAAALDLLLGAPTAYAISRRFIPNPLDNIVSGILLSPLTIPHTIVGF